MNKYRLDKKEQKTLIRQVISAVFIRRCIISNKCFPDANETGSRSDRLRDGTVIVIYVSCFQVANGE